MLHTKGKTNFFGSPCEAEGLPIETIRFDGTSIFSSVKAANPCVIGSPTVSWLYDLNFAYDINLRNERFLRIKGVVSGKGFPSYELFIEDASGQRVFLLTTGPNCETDLSWELTNPIDNHHLIDVSIMVDEEGGFLDFIDVATYDNSSYVNYLGCCLLLLNEIPTYTSYTLSNWNSLNLNKNPANDCLSIPCQGAAPNSCP